MRYRNVILGLTISTLLLGVLLFAVTTVRQTNTSTHTGTFSGTFLAQDFVYGGWTLTSDNPPQVIIGTSGIADLIIFATPWRDFNSYVCQQMSIQDCSHFGGGDINITILYSYLQTHKAMIAYSATIVDENVTLASIGSHVALPTDITVALAHLGPNSTRDFWQTTVTNETVSYPLIGYTESSAKSVILPSISLGLIIAGAAGLVAITVLRSRLEPSLKAQTQHGSAMQACPACGGQNLFFAKQCQHCGGALRNDTPTQRSSS